MSRVSNGLSAFFIQDTASTRKIRTLLWLFIICGMILAYGYAIATHNKQFNIWGITEYFIIDENYKSLVHPGLSEKELLQQKREKHDAYYVHIPRIYLIAPIIYFSKASNIALDHIFAWSCLILILLTAYVQNHGAALFRQPHSFTMWFGLFLLLNFGISWFMNGRILFAFLGISLLLYGQIYWLERKKTCSFIKRSLRLIPSSILGLWLMSVSSGALMVGLVTIGLFLTYLLMTWCQKFKRVWVLFFIMMTLIILFPVLALGVAFIIKNIMFFYLEGNGIILGLLNHGYGQIFVTLFQQKTWAFFLILPPYIAIMAYIIYRLTKSILHASPYFPLWAGIVSALLVGLVGLSACSLLFPAFAIWVGISSLTNL